MISFYFGSTDRRLFGAYHPAQGGGGNRAVLLCYPWGFEYANAHRSMVRLANLLSQAGYHALRFDYYGTGDSAGEDRDADLSGAREDIARAIGELRELSGVETVSIIGLPLGAALAVMTTRDMPSMVDRLVLWDPVIDGVRYMEELYDLDDSLNIPGVGSAGVFSVEDGGGREVMGLPLTARVASEISGVKLTTTLSGLPNETLVIVTCASSGQKGLKAYVDGTNGQSTFERIEDHAAWHEDWPDNAGVIPVSVLNRILSWMR